MDRDREGLVPGEAAATIILETYEHAKRRGATIYAELLGYAGANDSSENVSLFSGDGLEDSMRGAIEMGRINPNQIDVVAGHFTGTGADEIEAKMIHKILSEVNGQAYIWALKQFTGHTFGAAGSLQMLEVLLSMRKKMIWGNPNLFNVDYEKMPHLNYAPQQSFKGQNKLSLINAAAFGGQCYSLLVANWN